MKKMIYLGLAVALVASTFTSCKKTKFEKGTVMCKIDGKTYTSSYSANASVAPGILTVGTQGKTGSDIYPTQLSITFTEAQEGVVGTSDNMVVSGSKFTDTFATHWDSNLVGSASGELEIFTANECKGTFEATVKSEDGSKTFNITEGKFWLDI